MANKQSELQEAVKGMLKDPIIIIGYLEHQLDLMGKIVEDLAGLVDTTKLDAKQKQRISDLKDVLEYSSLDFDNMAHPLQSYKLPKAIEMKADTRYIQDRYLKKQIKEGFFG